MCLLEYLWKKHKNTVKYQELCNIHDENCKFNISRCSYSSINKIAIKEDIDEVRIGKDRLIFANDEYFKFDYMLRFVRRKNKLLTIVALGFVNSEDQLTKADAKCSINLNFTSDSNLTQFMDDLCKHILIYKRYNTYDKSVMKFRNFTR